MRRGRNGGLSGVEDDETSRALLVEDAVIAFDASDGIFRLDLVLLVARAAHVDDGPRGHVRARLASAWHRSLARIVLIHVSLSLLSRGRKQSKTINENVL